MSANTEIAWTDSTFNPWWGCTKVSPGCAHCYAETFDKRVGGAHWGPEAERRFFLPPHWAEPLKWERQAAKTGVRRRVFCGSMCDVFEDRRDLDYARTYLWETIKATPHLDWLLLTKRPENLDAMLPVPWSFDGWPNVWLGVTAETQAEYDRRVSILTMVPARVHFVSAEPQLDVIVADEGGIDWTICGGESGPGARPFNVEWARTLLASCRVGGSAFFMKQLGGARDKRGRIEDLPEDLRIREFPRGQP